MKIIYAGTSEFSMICLNSLYNTNHTIELIITKPDKLANRGLQLQISPIKQYALVHDIPIIQPISLQLDGKFPETAHSLHEQLYMTPHDIIVVAAYGLILPHSILKIPRYGCINIHASLLPKWRGAAPIHRSIEAGDKETGITIIQMIEELDAGPILMQKKIPIIDTDNTGSLHKKLAKLGSLMIIETIKELEKSNLFPVLQCKHNISYADKINKKETILDFTQSASLLARKIRAFNPFPGALTQLGKTKIKLWKAYALPNFNKIKTEPGNIISANTEFGILIGCGEGILQVTELQRSGGKPLLVSEFLNGFLIKNNKFL